MRADLHTHTICSDGKQTFEELADAAKRAGVDILSVTDHDNMDRDDEKRRAINARGIIYVPGIEISAYEGDCKVHITGYNLDPHGEAYLRFIKERTDGSYARAEDTIKKLAANGITVTMDEIIACRPVSTSPVHTMHIARAVAKRGYFPDEYAVYNALLKTGKPAHSGVARPTPYDAVRTIREAGGICSLAHPGRIELDECEKEKLLKRLADAGLDGIEAVYSTHTDYQTEIYRSWAEKYSLLVTGGSDTHKDGFEGIRVGYPVFEPSEELLSALKIKRGKI